MTNTRLTLQYRCASASHEMNVVITGAITQEQVMAITSNLIDGYQIVAPQVNLPSPLEEALMDGELDCYDETDHPLTNLVDWEEQVPDAESLHTMQAPTVDVEIKQLTSEIAGAKWDQLGETLRLDLPPEDYALCGRPA